MIRWASKGRVELMPGPTRYHLPHLCTSAGGEVRRWREEDEEHRVRVVSRCWDCGYEVDEADTLAEDQMHHLDVLMGQSMLAIINTDQLNIGTIYEIYQRDLAQVLQEVKDA